MIFLGINVFIVVGVTATMVTLYIRENFQYTVEICETKHFCDSIVILLTVEKL